MREGLFRLFQENMQLFALSLQFIACRHCKAVLVHFVVQIPNADTKRFCRFGSVEFMLFKRF